MKPNIFLPSMKLDNEKINKLFTLFIIFNRELQFPRIKIIVTFWIRHIAFRIRVGSNPVHWVEVQYFFEGFRWVCSSILIHEPVFGKVRSSRFDFSWFGLAFVPFPILSSGFLEGFKRVHSSVWVDDLGFKWVRNSTCQVRNTVRSSLFLGLIQHFFEYIT